VAFFFLKDQVLTYKATGMYGELIDKQSAASSIVNREIVALAARNQPASYTRLPQDLCKNNDDAFLMYDGPGSAYIGGTGPSNPVSGTAGSVQPLYLCSQLTLDKCAADQVTRRACPETCLKLGYNGAACDTDIFTPPTFFGIPDLVTCASVVYSQGVARACSNPFWNRFCPTACFNMTYLKSWCSPTSSPTELCMASIAGVLPQCAINWKSQISVAGDASGTGLLIGPFSSQANCEDTVRQASTNLTVSPCVASFLTLRNWGFSSCPSYYTNVLDEGGPCNDPARVRFS
jgi:hypothetical protein